MNQKIVFHEFGDHYSVALQEATHADGRKRALAALGGPSDYYHEAYRQMTAAVPPPVALDAAVDLALDGRGVLAYVYAKSLTVLGRDHQNDSIYFRPVGCFPAASVHALSKTRAELVAKITDSMREYEVALYLFDTPQEMFEWTQKNGVRVQ